VRILTLHFLASERGVGAVSFKIVQHTSFKRNVVE